MIYFEQGMLEIGDTMLRVLMSAAFLVALNSTVLAQSRGSPVRTPTEDLLGWGPYNWNMTHSQVYEVAKQRGVIPEGRDIRQRIEVDGVVMRLRVSLHPSLDQIDDISITTLSDTPMQPVQCRALHDPLLRQVLRRYPGAIAEQTTESGTQDHLISRDTIVRFRNGAHIMIIAGLELGTPSRKCLSGAWYKPPAAALPKGGF